MNSLEWSGGLDRWIGTVEWSSGVEWSMEGWGTSMCMRIANSSPSPRQPHVCSAVDSKKLSI